MDNLSGSANWTVNDQPKEKFEVVKKVVTKKTRKVKQLNSKKLDDLIIEVNNHYEKHSDKQLGDLLINLRSSKSLFEKYVENELLKK